MLSQYILVVTGIILSIINIQHRFCMNSYMINHPIRFDLIDNTHVIVKEISEGKYDFELLLPNGNRKTFIWKNGFTTEFTDKKGRTDVLSNSAVMQFALFIK